MQNCCRFEMQMGNDLTELRPMSAWLQEVCLRMALPDQVMMNLDLCANEAIANIISYAYSDQNRHEIDLSLELSTDQAITLTIQDDGLPFNPFDNPAPEAFDRIEDAKIGGLGVHLIRGLMDECNYRRSGNKNILTLVAKLDKHSAETPFSHMSLKAS